MQLLPETAFLCVTEYLRRLTVKKQAPTSFTEELVDSEKSVCRPYLLPRAGTLRWLWVWESSPRYCYYTTQVAKQVIIDMHARINISIRSNSIQVSRVSNRLTQSSMNFFGTRFRSSWMPNWKGWGGLAAGRTRSWCAWLWMRSPDHWLVGRRFLRDRVFSLG